MPSTLPRVALGVVVLLLAFVPFPPQLVERVYSTGLFAVLQPPVTWISNRVPFALLDGAAVAIAAGWVWLLIRDVRRMAGAGWARLTGRIALRTATLAAVLYLAFLVFWGFNYQRLPMVQRFAADAAGPTSARAQRLVAQAIEQLNTLHAGAHASPMEIRLDGSLAAAFARAQSELAITRPARPARPKFTLLDPYFRSAAVAGMTDPFFLETLVASDLLPIERPFVIAHEWSHLAGFADEGEANFLGWLTCLRGSALDRYSGWLSLYSEAIGGLPRPVRELLSARLAEGPRADLRAIAERARRNIRPRVARAGWRVYDSYLRANRVEGGTASYREIVRLILSVQFDDEWVPELRQGRN